MAMIQMGCPNCNCDKCAWRKRKIDPTIPDNVSSAVDAMLTDFYQITMAYAYFKSGKLNEIAVFDAFFRKCPFGGSYAIVAGIDEVLRFINAFGYSADQIEYLRGQLPDADPLFFEYLTKIDASEIQVWGMREGDVAFPREPIVTVSGPLIVAQLLETTILNLLNYPSLVATCAARHHRAACDVFINSELEGRDSTTADQSLHPYRRASYLPTQEKPILLEFGCRRAQGPDGALSGSRYSYLGGFDGSSNTKAGHLFDIPVKGTHAHAFVTAFSGLEDLALQPDHSRALGKLDDFVERVLEYRSEVPNARNANEGELVAFIRYAQAFPKHLLVLVDTYDTLISGVPNFLCVALALDDAGYMPVGVRLDSGDLAYLSIQVRKLFDKGAHQFSSRTFFKGLKIAASNDINESVLNSLNEQGHSVDVFGIGTNLITCQTQPALGMVYKLVELEGRPRMKLSEVMEKISIPSKKQVYRLYSKENVPILDLMQRDSETAPKAGNKIFCRHVLDDTKRCNVTPSKIEPLLHLMWDGKNGIPEAERRTLQQSREYSLKRVNELRADHLRPINPTPYKVSVSNDFFEFFRNMWHESAPVRELS
eukprot:GEMP01018811.1.p1 GENE.GEMP01018811.1~~GEMP01018811.1.p1  ORF type:complete len:595 (+),score=112.99 GEMP01018811.1:101-1885(+)